MSLSPNQAESSALADFLIGIGLGALSGIVIVTLLVLLLDYRF